MQDASKKIKDGKKGKGMAILTGTEQGKDKAMLTGKELERELKRIAHKQHTKNHVNDGPILRGEELKRELKRIANMKYTMKKMKKTKKTTLPDIVFQDGRKLKPRARNKAAVAWLQYHTNDTIQIEDCTQMINGVAKKWKKYKLYDADRDKWITLRALHATVDYVEKHCGRNFIDDMRGDISKYAISIVPSDFC